MRSVQEAEQLISEQIKPIAETITAWKDFPIAVLRENLYADRPLPPFDRVAMDGIALVWQSWQRGQTQFKIAGQQKAGQAQETLQDPQECFEVMTGAVLPQGCDTVVAVEDLIITASGAQIKTGFELEKGQNIHFKGSDATQGQVLLEAGKLLYSPQWAVAASVGKTQLKLSQSPRIALVSTGDELVSPEETPLPHQIRSSNRFFFASALAQTGIGQAGIENIQSFHLPDQKSELEQRLATILSEHQVLILSGGVSMGQYDFVPEVLKELHVHEVFHKVRQRPGKPLWFGVGPQAQLVFGLPGNPVSSAICLYRYVLPALRQMQGQKWQQKFAILDESVTFSKNMTYFLAIKAYYTPEGQIMAHPQPGNGSGDFASLAHSDGFLELPAECDLFKAGNAYPLWLWQV
jgi:molybdopterin molybdotransferase